MGKAGGHTSEIRIALRNAGGTQDFSSLSSLGFDSVTITKSGVVARKAHSTDIGGRPHHFSEIEINRDWASLRYKCPPGASEEICRLRSMLLFMRVLCLFHGAGADLQSVSSAFLPPLETCERIAARPYELLSKKASDLEADNEELSAKNESLMRSTEESANACFELESRVASLKKQLEKYESVPDDALCELLFDWLSSHRGRFNAALFARENKIPLSRAEEGIDLLLKSGSISRVDGGAYVAKTASERIYSIGRQGTFSQIRSGVQSLLQPSDYGSRRAIRMLGKKK